MNWICSILILLIAVCGRAIKGRWSNLLTVFAGFYGITFFLANLRLNGTNAASDHASMVILIGVFSFFVAYLIVISIYQRNSKYTYGRYKLIKQSEACIDSAYTINKGVLKVAIIIVSAYTLFRLYILFSLLRAGYTYSMIRTIYFNNDLLFDADVAARYGRNQLDIYVIQPVLLAIIIIACICFFTDALHLSRRKKIGIIALAFLLATITGISNGGREIIFYFVLLFIFCYLIFQKKGVFSRKDLSFSKSQKRIIRWVVFFAVIIVVVMTFSRKEAEKNPIVEMLQNIYL